MGLEVAFGPNDIIGARDLVRDGYLGGVSPVNFLPRPAPGRQSFPLRWGGASGANNRVKIAFGLGFVEERNDHDRQGFAFLSPGIHLCAPTLTYRRMQD